MRTADRKFDEAMVAQKVKGSRGEEVVPSNNCYIFLPGAGHRRCLWLRGGRSRSVGDGDAAGAAQTICEEAGVIMDIAAPERSSVRWWEYQVGSIDKRASW